MSSLTIGLISTASVFCGALLVMGLQQRLPGHHLSKEMQDLVKLSAGTIGTLTALVLGLLVSSAKSSFDDINAGIVQSSAKLVALITLAPSPRKRRRLTPPWPRRGRAVLLCS